MKPSIVLLLLAALSLSGSASAQKPNVIMQTLISSQDAEGMTRKDMTMNFLSSLENYNRQQLQIKTQANLEAKGFPNKTVVIKSESVYLETGGQKLAVIRLADQFDMTRTVIIHGLVGRELKRVLCNRASNEQISLVNGPCAEKIREAFGVSLMH